MGKLQNRIVIVTGGASGIGRGCAELFAAEGARVVVADIREDRGSALAKELGGSYLPVDVTDPASVEEMIQRTVERHGRIDVLMNNAGIDGEPALTAESSLENWRKVLAINLDGGPSSGILLAQPQEGILPYTALPFVILVYAR